MCLPLTKAVQPVLDNMHDHAAATRKAAFVGLSAKDEKHMLQILASIKENLLTAGTDDPCKSETGS